MDKSVDLLNRRNENRGQYVGKKNMGTSYKGIDNLKYDYDKFRDGNKGNRNGKLMDEN